MWAMELGPKNVEDGVIFRFYSPSAKKVSIAGDFNGWDKNKDFMIPDKNNPGYFTLKLSLKEGEYAYKFVIDSKKWVVDKYATKFVDDGFGGKNSVIVVKRPENIEKPVINKKILKKGNVVFKYRSTKAKSIAVVGDFNRWEPDKNFLSDDNNDGVWELEMFLPPGRYTYFFVIDGKEWRIDPKAKEFKDDGFGGKNSVMVVGE